ncbi:HlyD family secretion protein/macrolide-specific efflux system membrane fusion protein [Paenibacillus endophyticus]|uniref:HlyD family secretion protein/macrolide-specific efflux system membrane fusion protein n=1 Tax=Paenibacillus endophyticus TaxID=1294268 RepID=A0A7W5G9F7_9BACL|nr:efflux RND transporter periplasmic adaptor subunit [Paenibacillus endophyticus]MBB3151660.1 HlyD family secretion protein/macrolide-specific efflux system membrane fusion protein [Paenibacillus endophyticus]
MKSKIKWIIFGIVIIAISFGLFRLGNPSQPDMLETESEAIVFQVTKGTISKTVEVKGKSLYEQETLVYAPYSSEVSVWNVQDGQQVKAGDVLFKLNQSTVQNEIVQMEAKMHKARLEAKLNDYLIQSDEDFNLLEASEGERKKSLVEREVSKLNKELREVTIGIQEKELQSKKEMLNSSIYRSPAKGIFLFDNPSKRPQMVGQNEYVGKIVDLSKLQFIALVGEQDIFRIKEGMSVNVMMSAKKELIIKGKVQSVSKFAKFGTDQNNLNQAAQFEVVIGLESNEFLIAGLSLSGSIETEKQENATIVPSIAIAREKDKYFVMHDSGNGKYERKEVKIGLETPEQTEVLEGLKPGDQVALP